MSQAPINHSKNPWCEPVAGAFQAAAEVQAQRFNRPPAGHDDPLLPAVRRFVAARPIIGRVALMRRFGVGRQRAAQWLEVLCVQRVCLGNPVRGVLRVNPHAWAALQGE